MDLGDEPRDDRSLGNVVSDKYYDQLEVRDPGQRERAQFNLLPGLIRHAVAGASGWQRHLEGIDAAPVTSREALAKLPVLKKGDLKDLQAKEPPFGGLATSATAALSRVFMARSPAGGRRGWMEPRAGSLRVESFCRNRDVAAEA